MAAPQQQQLLQPRRAAQPPHWWAQPLHGVGSALQGLQHNLQQFAGGLAQQQQHLQHAQQRQQRAHPTGVASVVLSGARPPSPVVSSSSSSSSSSAAASSALAPAASSQHRAGAVGPVTKEELGRATWVFLHTLAAQFPAAPSRQQQRDVRQLIDSLTRIYPCADCAQHFRELVRRDPPDVSSGQQLSLWMCRTHNAVNRRLGKPGFNCDLVAARWAPLDCGEENACDLAPPGSGKRR